MEKKLIDTKGLMEYTSLGKTRAIQFARSNNAEVRIGRRCLYDVNILNEVIEGIRKGEITT